MNLEVSRACAVTKTGKFLADDRGNLQVRLLASFIRTIAGAGNGMLAWCGEIECVAIKRATENGH